MELETEQNCNILTPTLMAISVSFQLSWAAQPEARGTSSLLDAVFSTSSFLQLFWSPNSLNFLCTELYNSSMSTKSPSITGYRNMHFRRLWNGMFDRHRAEITVMQFTGHCLLVHQFVTVPWDFNPVPYCQPSSPTPMEYATSAVFGMAYLAGSEVNILHQLECQVNLLIIAAARHEYQTPDWIWFLSRDRKWPVK